MEISTNNIVLFKNPMYESYITVFYKIHNLIRLSYNKDKTNKCVLNVILNKSCNIWFSIGVTQQSCVNIKYINGFYQSKHYVGTFSYAEPCFTVIFLTLNLIKYTHIEMLYLKFLCIYILLTYFRIFFNFFII